MGHELEEWRKQVLDLLRDPTRQTFGLTQVDEIGIVAALSEHSVNRPRLTVVEVSGNGTDTYDLPTGWQPGFSHLERVEYPARQSPPIYLDVQSWNLIRKTGALATEQVQLDRTVAASLYIRWWFTTGWPTPAIGDATVDVLDDAGFRAVCSLAASLCLTARAIEVANMGGDASALTTASKTYRGVYLRYLGIDQELPDATAPASRSMDFDPQYWSMFHGGRQ